MFPLLNALPRSLETCLSRNLHRLSSGLPSPASSSLSRGAGYSESDANS
jgi:hypothetical protein